ncbi:phosphoprotein phosphatase 1 domain protein [Necator americanus]|uniref:Serine/threonine-protein phosphatase n=1 Tax=Necator americanus TaxID=51031 RepID=W2TH09_NECAM|nr:phosphoprotein phosphatase 1 domain protein [Necator americanus]ETN80874.1 phosphoprotein phosphatase 1 domain protein [Necator americanus]
MLEGVIKKIWTSTPNQPRKHVLSYNEMWELCLRTRELLLIEPCFIKVDPPVVLVGDVHGQLYDMLEMISFIGHPPSKRMLFLGDYVDRGDYGLETITLLLALKLRFPDEIYLLRGNHETRCVNRQYGFFDECKRKFPRKEFFVLRISATSVYYVIYYGQILQIQANCMNLAHEVFPLNLDCRVLIFKRTVKPSQTPRGVSHEELNAVPKQTPPVSASSEESKKKAQSIPTPAPIEGSTETCLSSSMKNKKQNAT